MQTVLEAYVVTSSAAIPSKLPGAQRPIMLHPACTPSFLTLLGILTDAHHRPAPALLPSTVCTSCLPQELSTVLWIFTLHARSALFVHKLDRVCSTTISMPRADEPCTHELALLRS